MDSEHTTGLAGIPTPDWFEPTLHFIAFVAEVLGVAAIIIGALVAIWRAGRQFLDPAERHRAYHTFRLTLARGILLGLEFLLAADIIGTVTIEPTLPNLAVLAVIVAIRTFLSFALHLEIEGRLPWQKADEPETK